jgi:tetratricopeptide (TPR) repeat protein
MGVEHDQNNKNKKQSRQNTTFDELTAKQHFRAGRFNQAAAIYEQLCSNLPERLDIRARLGYLALLANDLDDAVRHLSQAINLGHRSRRTLSHLADAYYRMGRLGSAAYCYQRLDREGLAGTLAVMQDLDIYQLSRSDVSVDIPWLAAAPLPVIEVQINGRKANMVLDTGAGDTVIDARLALDAGIRLGGQEHREFAGGMPAQVTYGHLEQLVMNGLEIRDIPVQVIDIPDSLADWFPDLPIYGILGTGLYANFTTTLDYYNKKLRLAGPGTTVEPRQDNDTADQPMPVQTGAPLWLAENQLPLTCADLPSLKQGLWFLDSGMTGGAFAVPGTSIESLGLTVDESDALVGTGGGGTVHGHKLYAGWLRLDQLRRDNPNGVTLDTFPLEHSYGFTIQGLIGHDMLHDAILTLDFPAMQLFLAPVNN